MKVPDHNMHVVASVLLFVLFVLCLEVPFLVVRRHDEARNNPILYDYTRKAFRPTLAPLDPEKIYSPGLRPSPVYRNPYEPGYQPNLP